MFALLPTLSQVVSFTLCVALVSAVSGFVPKLLKGLGCDVPQTFHEVIRLTRGQPAGLTEQRHRVGWPSKRPPAGGIRHLACYVEEAHRCSRRIARARDAIPVLIIHVDAIGRGDGRRSAVMSLVQVIHIRLGVRAPELTRVECRLDTAV